MISVDEARSRITGALKALPSETVALSEAVGRALSEDVIAQRTQPPHAMSAMDGYAVRSADVGVVPAKLTVVGEAPAGGAFAGTLEPGQAVRIFTGGPLPDGADAVVMQEDTEAEGATVTIKRPVLPDNFVRPAGLDFQEGNIGLRAGRRLSARDIGLAAAMDAPWLSVRRKPRIALLANGDELVRPGDPVGPNQIICSNTVALKALVEENGGVAMDLGIAADTADSVQALAAGAKGCDLLVTAGGASVGDHDLIRSALGDSGLDLDFWRIAMRPGKPLIFGRLGDTPMLGLPGNPTSALVCGLIFMLPAINALLGLDCGPPPRRQALLGAEQAANSRREAYLRARLGIDSKGREVATPFEIQDSSVLTGMAEADCLVVLPPDAPELKAGEIVEIVPLGGPEFRS